MNILTKFDGASSNSSWDIGVHTDREIDLAVYAD